MTLGLFPFGTDALGATSSGSGGTVLIADLPALTAAITAEDRGISVNATLPALAAAIVAAPTMAGVLDAVLPAMTGQMVTSNEYPPPANYRLGRRELTSDFALGHLSANLSITKRPDAVTFDYLVAFSLGPKNIGDLTSGIINRPWYVRVDNAAKAVYTSKANDANNAWLPETILFNFSGEDIEEIDFAFEQAGRPVVSAERLVAGVREVWLYWFKPFIGTFVFEKIENGRTPRVVLDNPPDISNSDVQLFYIKTGTGLVNRVQREAYNTAHATPHVEDAGWYLEDVFYTSNWRVACILVQHTGAGKYNKKRMETGLMPVFLGAGDNNMTFGQSIQSLLDRVTLFFANSEPESYQFNMSLTSLDDGPILVFFTQPSEDFYQFPSSMQSLDDHIALLFHTLFDIDNYQFPMSMTSLADPTVVILHTMHDTDNWQFPMSLTSIDDS